MSPESPPSRSLLPTQPSGVGVAVVDVVDDFELVGLVELVSVVELASVVEVVDVVELVGVVDLVGLVELDPLVPDMLDMGGLFGLVSSL